MTVVDQQSLMSSLIPDIFIEGVTLETTGGYIPAPLPLPYGLSLHPSSSRKKWVPAASRHGTSSASASSSALTVSVDVSIKEVMSNDMVGRWLEEEDFQKYLKIKIIQSKDPKVTRILSSNQAAIELTSAGGISRLSPAALAPLLGVASPAAQRKLLAQIRENTERKDISIASALSDETLLLFRSSVEMSTTGGKIYNFSFRTKYIIPNDRPPHLAYFAVSYIDMAALQADYGFSTSASSVKEQNGKVASEIVIDNSKIVSQASVFRTSRGAIWAGPVHKVQRKWWSGSKPSPSSEPLIKSLVPNSKVHDFRIRQQIKELDISLFGDTNEEILRLLNPPLTRDSMITMSLIEKGNCISELLTSRDPDGSCRMFFGVNMLRALEENSPFGKILQYLDTEAKKDILSNSKTVSAKILRKRVRRTNILNSISAPKQSSTAFDENVDPTEVLISASGDSIDSEGSKFSLREVKLATVSSSSENAEMRYFTAMDKTISSKTDGLYTYGVDFEIEDGIKEFLLLTIRGLNDNITLLKEYQRNADAKGMNKAVLAENPHIDHELERPFGMSGASGANYDVITGRFTSEFTTKMIDKYPSSGRQPWKEPITDFIYALEMFGARDTRNVTEGLFSMINPSTGSIVGVLNFINLYDSLTKKLQLVTGVNDIPGPHASEKVFVPSNPVNKLFQVSTFFDSSVFDVDIRKYFGYDYLSSKPFLTKNSSPQSRTGRGESSNTDGLKLLEAESWKTRVNYENRKWFSDPQSTISLAAKNKDLLMNQPLSQNDFMFLTPSRIFLGSDNNVFDNDLKTVNYENYSIACATLYSFSNATLGGAIEPSLFNRVNINYRQSLAPSLASFGAILQSPSLSPPVPVVMSSKQSPATRTGTTWEIVGPPDPEIEITAPVVCVDNVSPSSTRGISPLAPHERKDVVANTFLRDFIGPFVRFQDAPGVVPKAATETISSYDLNVETSAIRSVIRWDANIPNQVLSVAAGSVNPSLASHDFINIPGDFIRDPKFSSVYELNIGLLNSVEFFDGFEEDTLPIISPQKPKRYLRKLDIKRASWKPLDRASYSRCRGDVLLCRLRPYSSATLGLGKPQGVALPVYDEYFFIRPPGTTTDLPGIRERTTRALTQMWAATSLTRGDYITSNVVFDKK